MGSPTLKEQAPAEGNKPRTKDGPKSLHHRHRSPFPPPENAQKQERIANTNRGGALGHRPGSVLEIEGPRPGVGARLEIKLVHRANLLDLTWCLVGKRRKKKGEGGGRIKYKVVW